MTDVHKLSVVSYNLHGLNQGRPLLESLCNDHDIVMVQEHWLAPYDLDRLNCISNGMVCYSSSAMDAAISQGCLRGRPFGGLAIFVKNAIAANTVLVKSATRYIIMQFEQSLIINVYLPCAATVCRDEEFTDTLACIMNDITDISYSSIIFGGDMNVDFAMRNHFSSSLMNFTQDLELQFVDDKLPHGRGITFKLDTTGAMSAIDHFAVSQSLYDNVHKVKVIECGSNLSDHSPLVMELSLPVDKKPVSGTYAKKDMYQMNFRWDHGDIIQYYVLTRDLLNAINVPTFLLSSDMSHLSKADILAFVNRFYTDIICALHNASYASIPRKKHSFYKYWWDEELVLLKETAIKSFKLWSALGKPRTGAEFDCMRRDKLLYKMAIKAKSVNDANQFSNSLNDALLDKDMNAFWITWRSKFGNQQLPSVIDGASNEKDIADRFATAFQSVCVPNSAERHEQLQSQFIARFARYTGDAYGDGNIDVELVEKCVNKLKKGKASGVDHLTAEHISLAHPVLIVQLTLMFNILTKYSLVPDAFGHGIIIPLLKNPDGDRTASGNYRGITLSPVISKLFEMVLMVVFDSYLKSDSLQFGFKQHSSCSHALFTLRTVIDHYVKSSSTVNICALDISKAFDRVNQFALFNMLMDRSLPRKFIGILLEWLTKCFACVRWGCTVSFWFHIKAGVRQGGCLSPILFAVYMDVLITRLRKSGFGCRLLGEFYGCILYADDIMLLSHSVNAMRCMLHICDDFAYEYDLKFNTEKSVAMRIGPRFDAKCVSLELAGKELQFVQSLKYLGTYWVSARRPKCSVDHIKVKFYRAFNCVYSKSKGTNSELVTVELLKSYCLPFILYASEVLPLSATNIHVLDNCISRALYRIFGIGDAVSLQQMRTYLGLSSVSDLIEVRKRNFMDRLTDSGNYGALLKVFIENLF